ncbi:PQQ-dependent sugar dehydrogenase [Flavobacterium cellulosilyticum]|uniref:T9SS type A sorting domain-containing protein n=1 Tax=Flavobacterium cellulosilyticum TaxID=2541731 RepID=A0A4R5CPH6_9FLAO|nr:PQQ-dependent sugar dehydrogenase [Flavobacterium cellulosilyticum]TDD99472.1 T9SS type A sorting domain-containing protein [Flavobacterium cellulosilyticum]
MNYCNRLRLVAFTFLILIEFSIQAQNETFTMTQIGNNNLLTVPWDLNYGPDNYLWVTEKTAGNVVRVNATTGQRDELIHISDAYSTGGQDGLLGMAFDESFLTGSPYVYLSYTYGSSLTNEKRRLVRYTYSLNGNDGSLSNPVILIDNLPAFNDHQSGRLVFGPDKKLYYTIGDQANKVCSTNLAQFLPSQQEIDAKNWSNYLGKVLRFNTDGSIPNDNPIFGGVQSHIFSYGHRNPQGLVFGTNGILYSDEHGPSSDDEVNIINSGKNYGWPFVAGIKDNLQYDADGCLAGNETSFVAANYQDPILTMFAPDAYKSPNCTDAWMCRPNVAPSSIAIYESNAIPAWKNSLLVTSLKKGRVYRLKLNAAGTAVEQNEITQIFYTQNRYRDIVASPDGKSFYIITDSSGKTSNSTGMTTVTTMSNPGAILKFTLNENLSVKSQEINNYFRIWTNPASLKLFIELKENGEKDIKAQIFNTLGQKVKEVSELKIGLNETIIDNLPAGVYILKIYSKTHSWHKNLVLN